LNFANLVPPKPSIWKHEKTGTLYRLIGFGIQEETLQPIVMYSEANKIDATVWTRTCVKFFDGRFTQVLTEVKSNA
jgi:hypothetical protein